MSRSSAAISPIVLAPLGPELAARKTELERIVDDGKVSFVAVGHALAELKADPEFYAPQSFENYAVQRFGFKKSRWYQTMAGAVVADIISPEGFHHGGIPVLPDTERTIRPLTRLLPRRTDEVETEQRDRIEAAWARACKLAEEEGATVAGSSRTPRPASGEGEGRKPLALPMALQAQPFPTPSPVSTATVPSLPSASAPASVPRFEGANVLKYREPHDPRPPEGYLHYY